MATNEAVPTLRPGPRATVSAGLIAAARHAFSLGSVAAVLDLGGTYSLNLRLRTDRETVVLRIYRPWVTPARLASVQAVRAGLHVGGLPVLPARLTRDGSGAITVDQRLVEAEPWRPDDGGAATPARNLAAAHLLAGLHTALRRIGRSVPVVPAPVSNTLPTADFDDWLRRTVAAVGQRPASAETRLALAACRTVAVIAEDARRTPQAHPPLPCQLTHGDFGHENVRFTGDTPSLIVDFDFLGVRPRVADLADLAFGPHWMVSFGQTERPPADRDWDAVAGLIRSYDAAAGQSLVAAEIAALPLAMAMLPLTWVAASWLHDDAVAALNLVAPELPTAAWLVHHHQDLARRWNDSR